MSSSTSFQEKNSKPDSSNVLTEDVLSVKEVKVFINQINSYHGSAISKALRKSKEIHDEAESEEQAVKVIDNDEEISDIEETPQLQEPSLKFFISGTIDSKKFTKSEFIVDEVVEKNLDDLDAVLLDQEFIIYDLNFDVETLDDVFHLLQVLENSLQNGEQERLRHLILISNLMTWGRTSQNLEENFVLSDKTYRKRRPHPCYRRFLRLEQEVTNLQTKFPNKIRTLIISPGITVGYEEDVLHYFFKMALYNKDDIEIFEPGTQKIPLIHVNDLANMVKNLLKNFPPETVRYVLAFQPSIDFCELITSIAERISGPDARLKICPKEEIFLLDKDLISQRIYDKLNLNLNLEIEYFSKHDFLHPNLEKLSQKLVDEYYLSRHIQPLKIIIHGPPTSGKTTLARALSCYYGLHYINVENILEESKLRLERKIIKAENYIKSQESYKITKENSLYQSLLEKTKTNIEKWRHEVTSLEKVLKNKNNPKKLEQFKEKYLRKRLLTNACTKNQGYVIDGMEMDIEAIKRIFLQTISNEEPSDKNSNGYENSEANNGKRRSVRISIVDPEKKLFENKKRKRSSVKSKSSRSSKELKTTSRSSDPEQVQTENEDKDSKELIPQEDQDSDDEEVIEQLNYGEAPYKIKPEIKPDLVVYLKFDDKVLNQQERCLCQKNKDEFPVLKSDGACSDCSLFLTSSSSSYEEGDSEYCTFDNSCTDEKSYACSFCHDSPEPEQSQSDIDSCTTEKAPPCNCKKALTALKASKLVDLVLPQSIKEAVRQFEQKRFENFRETEYEDKSFYTLMLDSGIFPLEIIINKETSAQMVYNYVKSTLGPRNEYLISDERREQEKRIREELKCQEKAKKLEEYERELEKKRLIRELQLEEELKRKVDLKRQELRDIEACSVPLREYLMAEIIPKLTQGLVEVAQVRPEDPIEYLAEYLFRNNPKGHMFDPNLSDRHIKTLLENRLKELAESQLENEDQCLFRIVGSSDLSFPNEEII